MMKLFYRRTFLVFSLLSLLGNATLQANPYATKEHLARVSQGLANLVVVKPAKWNSGVIQNLQNALYNSNEGTGLIIDFARIHIEEENPRPVGPVHFGGLVNTEAACLDVEKALADMWKTLKLLRSYYEALEEDQRFADDIRASFGEEMNEEHPYYGFTYTHTVEMWQHRNHLYGRGLEIPRRLIDSLRRDLGSALTALHPLLQNELGIHLRVNVPSLNGTRELRLNGTAMRSLANYFLGNLGIADTHFEIGPHLGIEDVLGNLREDLNALVPPTQAYTIDIDVEEDEETEESEDLTSSLESMHLSDDTTESHDSLTGSPPRSMPVNYIPPSQQQQQQVHVQQVYYYAPVQQVAPGYGQYGYPFQPGQMPPVYQQQYFDVQHLWQQAQYPHLQHPQPRTNRASLLLDIGNAYGGCFN